LLYLVRWLCLPLMRRPLSMTPRPGWKVGVATTFVPGAESIEMLEETVQALVAMDYPHETWVLDEGEDDEVKAVCARLGAYHFSRRDLPQYHAASGRFESRSKHGNYNAWLYEIGFDRYELIAAFDPDHVPQPDFLMQVLGYFDDPSIGYVQAAQAYYNQGASFIARGAAEETYVYYSSIQMTNYALGYPIVTGCHNTHRVTAVKEVGGFAPHAADDLLITLHYRLAGWKGVYLPKILARGLTPVDWSGFLIQQRRWARSALDVKFRIYPKVARKLPFKDHVANFVHGLYYLESIGVGLQLVLLAFILCSGITPRVFSFFTLPQLVLVGIALQSCEFYRQRFFLDPQHEVGLHWRSQVLAFAKWPIFLLAIYDVLTRYRRPYTITRKAGTASRPSLLLVPHFLILSLLGTAWASGMILGHITNPLLHVSAALIVLGSLSLILTTRLKFPPPYDSKLRAKAREGRLCQSRFMSKVLGTKNWQNSETLREVDPVPALRGKNLKA
jgi:cellulose synthase (UDP-forming)